MILANSCTVCEEPDVQAQHCDICVTLVVDPALRNWWDATVIPGRTRPLAARNPELARAMLKSRSRHIRSNRPALALASLFTGANVTTA